MKHTPYRAPPSFNYGNGELDEKQYCPNPDFPDFIQAERRCLNCVDGSSEQTFPNGNDGLAAYNPKLEACCPNNGIDVLLYFDPSTYTCRASCPASNPDQNLVCCPTGYPLFNEEEGKCDKCQPGIWFVPDPSFPFGECLGDSK